MHIILGITITFARIALLSPLLRLFFIIITTNHEVLQRLAIRGSWLCLCLAL